MLLLSIILAASIRAHPLSRTVRVSIASLLACALLAVSTATAQAQSGSDFDFDLLLGDEPSDDRSSSAETPAQASQSAEPQSAPQHEDAELDVISLPEDEPPESRPPPRFNALEEIVVTAQKRPEDIQSVPLSITAVSGKDIADKNMGDMNDVANYVPNLDVLATPSFPSIYMRGLGSSYNRGFEQSVALLIDDVYYGRASYINQAMLDLAAIEVLRGPQGTLFGKNASAGAIHFRTAVPEPDFGFNGDVLLGDLNQQRVRLTATGPLGNDVKWRAAVLSQTRDGSVDNTTIGIDEENIDNRGARLRLVWDATDALSADLILNANSIRQQGEGSQLIRARDRHLAAMQVFDPQTSADPFDERTAKDSRGRVVRDAYDATVKLDWTFADDYVLTSITNYTSLKEEVRLDADFSPIPFLILDNDETLDQYSQELRITSPPGELEFVGGLFYMRSDLRADYNIREFLLLTELLQVTGELERMACLRLPDPQSCQDRVLDDAASGRLAGELIQARQALTGGPAPVETALTRFDQITDSVALFGQATWHFTRPLVGHVRRPPELRSQIARYESSTDQQPHRR
jgi:iron complex outermembrane recepter protein